MNIKNYLILIFTTFFLAGCTVTTVGPPVSELVFGKKKTEAEKIAEKQAEARAVIAQVNEQNRCPKDNLDGTMIDLETSLVWQNYSLGRKDGITKYSWDEALKIAKSNRFLGKDDWILPTEEQMRRVKRWTCVKDSWGSGFELWTSTRGSELWTATSVSFGGLVNFTTVVTRNNKFGVWLVRGSHQRDIDEFTSSIAESIASLAVVKPNRGKAAYTFPNGNRYDGDWKNSKRHGNGTLFLSTGDRYEGEFKNDQFNGYGVYSWKNGQQYSGQWVDGNRHGNATVCGLGLFGTCEQQVWVNDKKDRTIYDVTSSSSSSFCSVSDTCFETVSTRGDEVTLKCTKGNNAGQERKIRGPNANGKWSYSLGGYHRNFREAGNFACD